MLRDAAICACADIIRTNLMQVRNQLEELENLVGGGCNLGIERAFAKEIDTRVAQIRQASAERVREREKQSA